MDGASLSPLHLTFLSVPISIIPAFGIDVEQRGDTERVSEETGHSFHLVTSHSCPFSLPHALSLLFVSHLISLLSMEEETDK